MSQSIHTPSWMGISYTVGDDVHAMPHGEYASDDTAHPHDLNEDCPCEPTRAQIWPESTSNSPTPPMTVWTHNPLVAP